MRVKKKKEEEEKETVKEEDSEREEEERNKRRERKTKGKWVETCSYHMFTSPFDCMHASVGAVMHPHSLRPSDPNQTALI